MASQLNPYLTFPGTARQAMEFYRDVFGGTLTMNTFGEYGDPTAANADQIMHAYLEADNGFALMGSDTPDGSVPAANGPIAISLSGDDAAALRGYWEKLSAAGDVAVPLGKQMWGDEFGACTDQFGISWMVDIAPQ